jgi:hypothetical protein
LPSSAVQGTKLVGLVAYQGGSLPLVDMGALAAGLGEGLKHALVMRSSTGRLLGLLVTDLGPLVHLDAAVQADLQGLFGPARLVTRVVCAANREVVPVVTPDSVLAASGLERSAGVSVAASVPDEAVVEVGDEVLSA